MPMVSEGNKPLNGAESGSSRVETGEPDSSPGDVGFYLQQARIEAARYLSAQADRLRALARTGIVFGILGIAGVLIGLTVVIVAAVLFCVGIAGGIGELLGGRQWVGDLIAGGGVLGVIGIGGGVAARLFMSIARRRTMAGYEKPNERGPTT